MQFHNNASVGVIGETQHWDFNLQSFLAANLTINAGGMWRGRRSEEGLRAGAVEEDEEGWGTAQSKGTASTGKRAEWDERPGVQAQSP